MSHVSVFVCVFVMGHTGGVMFKPSTLVYVVVSHTPFKLMKHLTSDVFHYVESQSVLICVPIGGVLLWSN